MFLNKNKDDHDTVTDFKQRSPFAGYRPIAYKIYEPFVNFKPTLDGHLERLCATEIDAGNKGALDNAVVSMAAKATEDLKRQQAEHADQIRRICDRRRADQRAFEQEMEKLKSALTENQQALEEAEERYSANKF